MNRLLRDASRRYLWQHPLQVVLAILGVALGVALILAIDLAIGSSETAFRLSLEGVTGRATHRIVASSDGLDESLYLKLRLEEGIRDVAPVVQESVAWRRGEERIFLELVGLDPYAEGPFRPFAPGRGRATGFRALLTQPETVLVEGGAAEERGWRVGDALELEARGRLFTLRICGTHRPADPVERRRLASVLVTDIATAQEVLGRVGRLSRIDVRLRPGDDDREARLREALPPDAELVPTAASSRAVDQMLGAFRVNLQSLSLLTLVVGVFLITNTLTFSVVQRRPLFGRLRALGVTRREILTLVLSEAAWLGVVATLLGLILGVLLGGGILRVVSATIEDLYFRASVESLVISPRAVGGAALLGVAASLLAALRPALEATRTAPRRALIRSSLETQGARRAPARAVGGALIAAVGALLLAVPSRGLLLGYASLLAILVGFSLATPWLTVVLVKGVTPLFGGVAGSLGRLCARGVSAHLSRTGFAIAALSVAVAMTVGVGLMIGSFRQNVVDWLESTLVADVYIASPSAGPRRASELPLGPDVVETLISAPGVRDHHLIRNRTVRWDRGETRLAAVQLSDARRSGYRVANADETLWRRFEGEPTLLASEPFAYRNRIGAGDRVRLRTPTGSVSFEVLGTFRDYASEEGYLLISRAGLQRHWNDQEVTGVAIYLDAETDPRKWIDRLRADLGSRTEIWMRSNRDLKADSLVIFDRTFAVTSVLRLLATVVAVVGILSALLALQLERRRELGVLRAAGVTPGQIAGVVLGQTALMGFIAGVIALPLGSIFAAVLTGVINRRSFGWSLDLALEPGVLAEGLIMAVGAALLAGLYPAIRLAAGSPVEALREE